MEMKEEERDLEAELPVFKDFAFKSRGGSGLGMGNINSGRSIVPSPRSRCVSVPL
jgi:hypothetical protein